MPIASSGSSDLPDSTTAALRQLSQWQDAGDTLGFVYARAKGGLMQTGRATIAGMNADMLTLDAGGSKLLILVGGASYESGPQLFFASGLQSGYHVDGVGVQLANHDWLFLSCGEVPPAALPGALVQA